MNECLLVGDVSRPQVAVHLPQYDSHEMPVSGLILDLEESSFRVLGTNVMGFIKIWQ